MAVAISMADFIGRTSDMEESRYVARDLNAVPCYFSLIILFIARFKNKC